MKRKKSKRAPVQEFHSKNIFPDFKIRTHVLFNTLGCVKRRHILWHYRARILDHIEDAREYMNREHGDKEQSSDLEDRRSEVDHTIILHHPAHDVGCQSRRRHGGRNASSQCKFGRLLLHHFDRLEDPNDLEDAQDLGDAQDSPPTAHQGCAPVPCARLPAPITGHRYARGGDRRRNAWKSTELGRRTVPMALKKQQHSTDFALEPR